MKKSICFLFLILCTTYATAQNSYLKNGLSGSGISAEIANGDNGFSQIIGSAAFSIGGVLDLGLKFGTTESQRLNEDATETTFGLVYNVLPLTYSIYMFDVMANVRGSYDYIIVDSAYIDQITGTMEGQGFSIALEGLLDFSPVDFLTLRGGYHIGHISHLFNIQGDDAGTPVDITERERNNENGFLVGIWAGYEGFPIIGYEALFLDSTNYGTYVKHRLSIVIQSN